MALYDYWKCLFSSFLVLLLLLLSASLTQWTKLESDLFTKDVGLFEYHIDFKGSSDGRDGTYQLSCDFVSDYHCSFLRSTQQAMIVSLFLTLLQIGLTMIIQQMRKPSGAYEAFVITTSSVNILCMVIMLCMYPSFAEGAFEEQDDTDYSTNRLDACYYLVIVALAIHVLFGFGLLLINLMGYRENLFGVPFHEMDHYKFSTDGRKAQTSVLGQGGQDLDLEEEGEEAPVTSPYSEFSDKQLGKNTKVSTSAHSQGNEGGNVRFEDDLDEALHESESKRTGSGELLWDSENNGGYHVATRLSDETSKLGQPMYQG